MDPITKLFCLIDDFCKEFEVKLRKRPLAADVKLRHREVMLSLSELMTLVALLHQIRYRQFIPIP